MNILPFQLSWNQVITQNVYLYDFFGSCLTCLFFLIPDYQISVQSFLSDPLSMASLIFAHEISHLCWIHMIASNLTVQANASEQLGTIKAREKNKKSYEQALVKRYHHLHEVKRIERHRHLPSSIYKVTVSWGPFAWDQVRNKISTILMQATLTFRRACQSGSIQSFTCEMFWTCAIQIFHFSISCGI